MTMGQLSRKINGQSLLNRVGGRAQKVAMPEPVGVFDPPQALSDEEASSSDGESTRGKMIVTRPGPASVSRPPLKLFHNGKETTMAKVGRDPIEDDEMDRSSLSNRRSTRQKRAADSGSQTSSPAPVMKKQKPKDESPTPGLGEHMKFHSTRTSLFKNKPKNKYRGQVEKQAHKPQKGPSKDNVPGSSDESRRSASPQFKMPTRDVSTDNETPSPKKFQKPSIIAETPSPANSTLKFRVKTQGSDPDNSSPNFKKSNNRSTWKHRRRRDSTSRKDASKSHSPEMSPVPVFKVPDQLLMGSQIDNHSQAIEMDNDVFSDDDDTAITDSRLDDIPDRTKKSPVCPICDEPVDEDMLRTFPLRSGTGFNQQMRFCAAHRKRSAQKDWDLRGYPHIDWQKLDARINKHHDYLRTVLEGKGPSHFRDLLSEKVQAGKARTLKKSDDKLMPGYYGHRGFRAMSDNIVGEFSLVLRRRAVQDSLVSARGYTSFVNNVLVPELAVQLIMEDMDVDVGEGRRIMAESQKLGELINEDVADVVLRDGESDGEDNGSDSDSTLSEAESI